MAFNELAPRAALEEYRLLILRRINDRLADHALVRLEVTLVRESHLHGGLSLRELLGSSLRLRNLLRRLKLRLRQSSQLFRLQRSEHARGWDILVPVLLVCETLEGPSELELLLQALPLPEPGGPHNRKAALLNLRLQLPLVLR